MLAQVPPTFMEVDRSMGELKAKLKLDTYVEEDVLLMKEGEHNGIFYPKQEIMASAGLAEGASLILDHSDTPESKMTQKDHGVQNWVGTVINVAWNENGKKGPGLYGDLDVVDEATARKLAYKPKFGISATTNFESNDVQGKTVASDIQWKSFSLVLQPAIRATMLNKKGGVEMTQEEQIQELKAEIEELKKKKDKYPYKYPVEKAKKKKKEEEEKRKKKKKYPEEPEMTSIEDVGSEEVLKLLQSKDEEIADLQEYKDKIETAKIHIAAEELAYNEFLIGKITEEEMEDRIDILKEKTADEIKMLSDYLGTHVELSAYTAHIKACMKTGKSMKACAVEWKKKKGKKSAEKADLPKASLELDAGAGDERADPHKFADPTRITGELHMRGKTGITDSDKALHDLFLREVDK